jgi:hypothetical protein
MSILMNAQSSSATTQSPARQSVERLSIRLKNERHELLFPRRAGLTLPCHAHNKLQAKRDFGEAHVFYKSAVAGLIRLGCRRKEAEEAVRMAMQRLPAEADLAAVVRESLRALRR